MEPNTKSLVSRIPKEILQQIVDYVIGSANFEYVPPNFHVLFLHPKEDCIQDYMCNASMFDVWQPRKPKKLSRGFYTKSNLTQDAKIALVSKLFKSLFDVTLRGLPFVFRLDDTRVWIEDSEKSILSPLIETSPHHHPNYYVTNTYFWPTQELERYLKYVFPAIRLLHGMGERQIAEEFFKAHRNIELYYDASLLTDIAVWNFKFAGNERIDRNATHARHSALHFNDEIERIAGLAQSCTATMVISGLRTIYARLAGRVGPKSEEEEYMMRDKHLLFPILFLVESAILHNALKPVATRSLKKLKVCVPLGEEGSESLQILPHPKMDELIDGVNLVKEGQLGGRVGGPVERRSRRLVPTSMRHYIMSDWLEYTVGVLSEKLRRGLESLDSSVEFMDCDLCVSLN